MGNRSETLSIETESREQMVDLTRMVADVVAASEVQDGMAWVYSPHTTAGITIQEGADPDVCVDLLGHLRQLVPVRTAFRHREGNSDAHIKTALLGASQAVPIAEGRLLLGTWQAIYFCDFDGPRSRRVLVKVMGNPQ